MRHLKRIASGEPAPECHCGGYLKPDTISFGQAMPEVEVTKSTTLARECDLFLVVGSTLLVQPAALLPDMARRSGAFLAIVNLSDTPYDAVCDALVQGKAGEVLPSISQQVLKCRVEDWRGTVSPFPVPASSNPACGFPAPGFPVNFI